MGHGAGGQPDVGLHLVLRQRRESAAPGQGDRKKLALRPRGNYSGRQSAQRLEFSDKKIKGAVRQDPDEVKTWAANLPKDKKIIPYSQKEGTIVRVAKKLNDLGLKQVLGLKGGWSEWRRRATPPSPMLIKDNQACHGGEVSAPAPIGTNMERRTQVHSQRQPDHCCVEAHVQLGRPGGAGR